MHGLSWWWIFVMVVVPPGLGVAVAYPLWRHSAMVLGSLAGAAVIFGFAFALIFREYRELDRLTQECIALNVLCLPTPTAFTRNAIYASIGLVEVCALFGFSLVVERAMRNRDYAPEWR